MKRPLLCAPAVYESWLPGTMLTLVGSSAIVFNDAFDGGKLSFRARGS